VLSSSLYDSNTGEERARFRLAQAFFLQDRDVNLSPEILAGLVDPTALQIGDENLDAANRGNEILNELSANRSESIATLDLTLMKNWRLGSELIWDSIESSLDRSKVSFSYEDPNDKHYLDVSYFRESDVAFLRDRDGDGFSRFDELVIENIDQASITGSTDWGENWRLTARWQFDFSNHRSIDGGIGLTYQSCCWNVSATWRRSLERDDTGSAFTEELIYENGVFLGFEWIGLGGVGQLPADILRRSRVQ